MNTHLRLNIVRALVIVAVLLCGYLAIRGAMKKLRIYGGELPRNRVEWEDKRPNHYRYTVEFGASSVLSFDGPVRAEVRNGKNVRFEVVSDNKPPANPLWREVDTIDKLFEFIERTKVDRHEEVVLEFDPQWHYPVRADMTEDCTDCETEVRVTKFEVLQIRQ